MATESLASTAALPRVDVLALGGTIAMAPVGGGGVAPQLGADQLLAAVPALAEIADVRGTSVRSLPGASLRFEDLLETADVARGCVDAGAAGVVVTQGTDSLEETAYALDLLWDRDAPLVVTGAMRPASAPGADGPGNIFGAVAAAGDRTAAGRGCLVVLGDEIHAAARVAKGHSTRPGAFSSPGAGPIGWVAEGRATFLDAASPRSPALVPSGAAAPDVALVTALLGADGRQLRAASDAGFQGVVLAAMGAGHVPQMLLPEVERAVERMPVAVASRTNAGPILRRTYAFPGSERDLHRIGVLDAGGLAPLKARVLLVLALWAAGGDRAEAERLFRARATGASPA